MIPHFLKRDVGLAVPKALKLFESQAGGGNAVTINGD